MQKMKIAEKLLNNEATELKRENQRLKSSVSMMNRRLNDSKLHIGLWRRDFCIELGKRIALQKRIRDNESTFMVLNANEEHEIKALNMNEARMIVQNTLDMSKKWSIYEVVRNGK